MKTIFLAILLIVISPTIGAQHMEQTNKHFWHTEKTIASAGKIWKIWTDVPKWKDWDVGLKNASITGNFELGTKGKIVSLEGRTSKFKVVEFKKGRYYTFKTNLPFGGLYVKRYLEEKKGSLYFTHEVWFKGLTARAFSKKFGSEFRKMLPEVMLKIKEIAEQ
ncbi:MAG: polyketide cyclase [Bacteroidota bacterium]